MISKVYLIRRVCYTFVLQKVLTCRNRIYADLIQKNQVFPTKYNECWQKWCKCTTKAKHTYRNKALQTAIKDGRRQEE